MKTLIPSKPAKYGIKIWCICDSATGYVLKMTVYLGKEAGADRAVGLGQSTVMDLVNGLNLAGRTLIADNFFSSLSLAKLLCQKKIEFVGTMRKNKKELPKEFVKNKRPAGEVIFGFQQDAMIVSYSPERNKTVVLLSTEHNNADLSANGKPEVIMTYNKGKGGVDHFDIQLENRQENGQRYCSSTYWTVAATTRL